MKAFLIFFVLSAYSIKALIGQTPEPDIFMEINNLGAKFGNSIAFAGDINGDDLEDFLVGANYYENVQSNEGAFFVYYGTVGGFGVSPDVTVESNQASAYLGQSVAAGDLNGDGYNDVLVGASWYDNGQSNEGVVFVFYGSASGIATSPDLTLQPNQSSAYFGNSGTCGDFNGDGYMDAVIGAYGYGAGGAVFIYYGSSLGIDPSPSLIIESDQSNSYYSGALAGNGDINSDGFDDLIVAQDGYTGDEYNEGRVHVYYGSIDGINAINSISIEEDQGNANFGSSVAHGGDINGDGYGDVIVGAEGWDEPSGEEGKVFVYLGAPFGLDTNYITSMQGDETNALFGCSVSGSGDINNDGFDDVVVGARQFSNGELDEGVSFVFYGFEGGLNDVAVWTVESDQSNADFGWSVAVGGDVNNDGFADVAVGAIEYDNGETGEGAVFFYYGYCETFIYYADEDGDGFGDPSNITEACELPFGYVDNFLDCNDLDEFINPLISEVCNSIDDDCNLLIDEGLVFESYYPDADGDFYGSNTADSIVSCSEVEGFVLNNLDCNDDNEYINPGQIELCNSMDDNCNDNIDEGLITYAYYLDFDGDTYGDLDIDTVTCYLVVDGYVINSTDCDDSNPAVYPDALEVLNGIDDDCDGYVDENLVGIGDQNVVSVNVYPNPFESLVSIEVQLGIIYSIEVFDTYGHVVASLKDACNVSMIDLSQVPVGLYYMSISQNNSTVSRVALIKISQ